MTLLWPGISMLICAGVMFWGSKGGKIRLARKLIDQTIAARRRTSARCGLRTWVDADYSCKRLESGKASGIDLWQSEDQAGNSPEATLAQCTIRRRCRSHRLKPAMLGNFRLPIISFDAIVSSWALHNIYEESGRTKALQEIARVLRPAGRVAIVDIRHAKEYSNVLTNAGFEVSCRGPSLMFFATFLLAAEAKTGHSHDEFLNDPSTSRLLNAVLEEASPMP